MIRSFIVLVLALCLVSATAQASAPSHHHDAAVVEICATAEAVPSGAICEHIVGAEPVGGGAPYLLWERVIVFLTGIWGPYMPMILEG